MPRPLLTALLALAAVPALCLAEDSGEKKLTSAEKKAQDQAAKLQELLGTLGVSEKSAGQAAKRYEAFRLKSDTDQKNAINRLVENFNFSSGGGAEQDAKAHFADRNIGLGSGALATHDSIRDAKCAFTNARKENPEYYKNLLNDPKAQDENLARHGIQPPDRPTVMPLVYGDERSLEARRAELKLQPLMKKADLPSDHAVWVLSEVKGLADLLEKGKDAQPSDDKKDDKGDDEGEGPRHHRRR